MEPSIYKYPDIFRRAHLESPGEIPAEVAFLQQVWKRHRKSPVHRVLDIACGDSPHGRLLAGDGFEVIGIDRSPTMIASGRAKAHGLKHLRFYRRAIEKFRIPERPFDTAIFMSETFPVIVENADLLAHLRSVGRALKRGGLYCIDIDRHDAIPRVPRRTIWRERSAQAGTLPLPVTTRDLIPVRYTIPSSLELAALASKMFKMEAAYSDLSFTNPLEKCRYRWLGILRRT